MRKKTTALVVTLLFLLGMFANGVFQAPSAHAASAVVGGLHVSGNKILDANNQQVLLHGVNRSGSEYACIQGWGIFDGPSDAASVQAMASWGANFVRIPINEDCWLNINGVNAAYAGANYQNAIVNYVNLLAANGMYAELSLMWGAPGTYQATYQPGGPDEDHSPALWAALATTFKNNSNVVLAPWGETTTGWTCFMLTGCSDQATYGPSNAGYQTASMQQAVNVMRGAGYNGVISIPCIDYANECANYNGSSWLQTHPTDTLATPQLAAEVHEYGNNACGVVGGTSCLDNQDGPLAASVPLIFGEMGDTYDGSVCNGSYTNTIMNWADAHQVGWAAWTWDTWGSCSSLSLISNYDGTVEPGGYGQAVKTHMLSYGTTPTQPPSPTPTPTQPPSPTPTPPSGGGNANMVAMGFAIGWQMPSSPPWGDINQEDLFALQTSNGTALDTHFLANVNVPAFVQAAHSHNVKALITIGGSSDQNWQNACVGANKAGFIQNLVNYMQSNGFDGIDLDIEDDAWMAIGPPDADMTSCIEAISTAAKAVKTQAGNTPIISGDVITNWAGPWWAPSQAYVDQFNLMTYGDTIGAGNYANDVQMTVNQGLPKNKFVGGIDVIDAPATSNQCGPFMQYTQTNGLLGAFVWDESTEAANGNPCFNQFASYIGASSPPPPPPSAPAVSLSVNSMNFGSVPQGTASSQQTVILTNTGNATLNIANIAISGTNAADFAKSTNCGASVAAGGTCSVNVAFTPSTTSAESATLGFSDDAAGSPQSVALSGTGTAVAPPPPPPPPPAPAVSLSPSSVNFGNVLLNSSGSATVTLKNTGNAPLTISGYSGTGAPFALNVSTCPVAPAALAAGASCTLTIGFTPTVAQTYNGSLSVGDNAANSPQTISLTGLGITGPPSSGNVVFQDGFESGNTSAWNNGANLSTGNSITVDGSKPHSGADSLHIHKAQGKGGDANVENMGAKYGSLDTRGYFYLSNMVGSGEVNLIGYYSQDEYFLGWVVLEYSNGGKSMVMSMYTGRYQWTQCSATPSLNAWHSIELQETASTTTSGAMAVYLDGVKVCGKTGIKTSFQTYSKIACVIVGSDTSDTNTGFDMYVDDVEMSTGYIGQ